MDTNEIKNKLHKMIDDGDEALCNVLMETAVEYETDKNFVVPQEWIDEAEQRSEDLRTGKSKGLTLEEFKKFTDKILENKLDDLRNNHYKRG